MANTLRFKRGIASGIPTALAGEPLFTTDTFDLYIGNGTTNTRFQKYIASGATTQILRGDGSLYTFPLAISSPSNGQVLKYNGTSWVNDSDAGITGSGAAGQVAYFTGATTQAGSNNLFWDATNNRLGIGTNAPTRALQVQGTGFFADNLQVQKDFIGATTIRVGNLGTIDATTLMQFALSEDGSTVNGYFRRYRNGTGLTEIGFSNALAFMGAVTGTPAERMRIFANGNIAINSTTDNGLRFQVTGDGYFSGSVGIGSTSLTITALRVSKNIEGGTTAYGVLVDSSIRSGVTAQALVFTSSPSLQNSAFTLTNLRHFYAIPSASFGSATVTNQYGFYAETTLTGATNNYGFFGDIAAATGRWNLYMNGTALNYINSSLLIGSTTDSGEKLQVTGTMKVTGASTFGSTITIARGQDANVTNVNINSGVTPVSAFQLNTDQPNTRSILMARNGYSLVLGTQDINRITLDTSGNLGLGVTPSAWGGPFKVMQLGTYGQYIAGQTNNADMKIGMNSYYNGTNYIYTNSGSVTLRYDFSANGYAWQIAPSGTAGNAITFTQAMTLDASGNLGVGTTSPAGKLEVNGLTFINNTGDTTARLLLRNTTTGASAGGLDIREIGVDTSINNASNGNMYFSTNNTERVRFFAAGNVGIGTGASDSGERLQVTGTAKITGASTFNGLVTISTSVYPTLAVISSNTIGAGMYLRATGTSGGYFTILSTASGAGQGAGKLVIVDELASATRFTIDSTGAATFSNSVTAGGNLLLTSGTASSVGAINLIRTGTSPVASRLTFGTDGTGYSFAIGKNQAGSVTDLVTILDSGAATFSSSIQAATAIAIGTTPDTNKPFKILKNINGTVGINFENTSTGASAFSAIQMGTDVSGGTKFTNIVYSSSGVAQSGVYYPDGTSIINIGTGGLNFYSQGAPIRMFNGGGNGVLKWEMVNDSFINHYTGTAPTTSATDGYRQYSADVVAGNAAPHFRTENGAIIKLYQETTGVGNAIFSQGGGNSVLDDSTFDGYTLRQIVRALRNQGILQ